MASNACASMALVENCAKKTSMSVNHSLVSMAQPAPIMSTLTLVRAGAGSRVPTVRSMMKTVLLHLVSMEAAVSTAPTITLVFVPMASPDPIANYPNPAVTIILARTAVFASMIPKMEDITLVSVPRDGPATIAKRSSTGAETRHARTVPVVSKEAPPSNVSAKPVGRGSFAMSDKYLARLRLSIRDCPVPSSFAKMEATAETLETVTNVFVPKVIKGAIVRRRLMNAGPIPVRMEQPVETSLALTNATARKASKARIANITSTTASPTPVKITASVTTWSTTSSVLVLMGPLASFAKSTSTSALKEHVIMEVLALTKLAATNVNVRRAMSDPDAREMSTSACPILAPLWEHRSVFSWSTTTTVSVVQDGWAVIVRPEETFAREILAKMAEFAPTRRDLIIVPVHQDTLEAIVSLRGRRAMARLVATEGPA